MDSLSKTLAKVKVEKSRQIEDLEQGMINDDNDCGFLFLIPLLNYIALVEMEKNRVCYCLIVCMYVCMYVL